MTTYKVSTAGGLETTTEHKEAASEEKGHVLRRAEQQAESGCSLGEDAESKRTVSQGKEGEAAMLNVGVNVKVRKTDGCLSGDGGHRQNGTRQR